MQKKLKMVEAVMFFNERGVCREMLFPEFEAVLDGVVGLPDLADRQVRLAYVLISPRREVRAAVFFLLDFDENGAADPGWNIPLRQLSERGGPGMDLGGGPIRLVCSSQCPISWHQMHLWDPEPQDLLSLRDAARRNQLGLLGEEEEASTTAGGAPGPSGILGPQVPPPAVRDSSGKLWSARQRQKTARLIKRQRLQIRDLSHRHEERLERLKQTAEIRAGALQVEVQQLRDRLRRQQELNAALEAQQRVASERLERAEAELDACREREGRGLEEILRLRDEHGQLAARGVEGVLGPLASLGLTFVAYHPGAGHLTIPLRDIAIYQENPMAYAAAHCSVGEEHYRQWLGHFQQPTCEAVLSVGRRCALPIDRVDSPRRFVVGESCYCPRHKPEGRRHRAG